MAEFQYQFQYNYHPVGQGLFASGLLLVEGRKRFSWVYDCGTNSREHLVDRELSRLKSVHGHSGSHPKIELVTISHFDRDHIGGLVRLLGQFSIGTLLLPYIPLWHRLLIAFEEGVDTQQDLMQFFVDPVGYILGREGRGDIDRIVFVPSSGDGEPTGPGETGPIVPEGEGPWPLDIDKGEPPDEVMESDRHLVDGSGVKGGTPVQFLERAGGLRVRGLWEFVPYNDADFAPADPVRFVKQATKRRNDLVATDGEEKRLRALRNLKDLYDEEFGTSGPKRNVISLFLYGGPVGEIFEALSFSRRMEYPYDIDWDPFQYLPGMENGDRFGQLFTGDGYLNTPDRLNRLCRYFRPFGRLDRAGVFQVMHHGAEGNWYKGAADTLNPVISVFSSDPERAGLGHPHAEVLRDFWKYRPVQADEFNGVELTGVVFLK